MGHDLGRGLGHLAGTAKGAHRVKIALILNSASGTALDRGARDKLRQRFADAGCEVREHALGQGKDMASLVSAAVAERPDAVVVGGGDGTLSSAAGLLMGGSIPLGVLRLGTFNHFAKDLGIPLELDGAVDAILRARRTAVDVGEVNGRKFINNSSLGIYPRIVRRRDALRSRLRIAGGKLWAFAWATVTAFRRTPFLDAGVCLDGKTRRIRTPFLFIGNNAYNMEGFGAGKRERLDGGRLSVYLTSRGGRLPLIGLGLRALFGMLGNSRDFEALAAQSLDVHSRHSHLLVALDGEIESMATPLAYRIHPGALQVLVPAAAPAK